jgi:hypothetical protein
MFRDGREFLRRRRESPLNGFSLLPYLNRFKEVFRLPVSTWSHRDIGKLSRGEFYFSTDGSTRPFKVRTPLCLSWHPANPPTAEEVVQKARANRLGSA